MLKYFRKQELPSNHLFIWDTHETQYNVATIVLIKIIIVTIIFLRVLLIDKEDRTAVSRHDKKINLLRMLKCP